MKYDAIKPFLFSILFFGMLSGTEGVCKEPVKNYRIGIAPIQVVSGKDLSFMGKGMESMMMSRIFEKDRISVIGRDDASVAFENAGNAYTKEILIKTGKAIQADYILWGIIQEEKEIFHVQFKMIDMKNRKEAFDFKKDDVTLDQMIPLASLISERIKRTILKEDLAEKLNDEGPDRHAHPDSLIPPDREKNTEPTENPSLF